MELQLKNDLQLFQEYKKYNYNKEYILKHFTNKKIIHILIIYN